MIDKNIKIDAGITIVIVLIFIVFSIKEVSFFYSLERPLYDIGSILAQEDNEASDKIILINIDDKSLEQIGPWPWPRSLLGEMIDQLNEKGSKLIGIDIPFSQKEKNEALIEIDAFRRKYISHPQVDKDVALKNWVLENLALLRQKLDNDNRLVRSIKEKNNIILTVPAGDTVFEKDISKEAYASLFKNFLNDTNIPPSIKEKISTDRLSPPFSELGKSAYGLGHNILTSKDHMAGRSHPPYISFKGSLFPSFPLRLALAYFQLEPGEIVVERGRIKFKDRSISVNDGEMLIRFKEKNPLHSSFSFVDVFKDGKGKIDPTGKIIILGLNNSDSRRFNTPVSSHMPELEFIARIVDNMISAGSVQRPFYMVYIEIFLIFLLGIFSYLFFIRKGPLIGFAATVAVSFILVLSTVFLLSIQGIWFRPVNIVFCLFIIYLYLYIRNILAKRIGGESQETSRLLGLNFQSQGLLDLAFEKFRKLPLNTETKNLIYNLGLEYEKKRMINKALSTYTYINKGGGFRDLDDRIPKLKASDKSSTLGSYDMAKEAKIISDAETTTRRSIGRYKILGELGKGSMGLVYKAQDPKIHRLVAIKTIRFSDEFDEDVIQEIKERFFREAEIAGQLSHPSIVIIHDVGDDLDLTYMAMEYLEGEDLDKYIKKDNLLPFRKVLDIVASIAEALDFAHKSNVIHRDIKPANVMMLKDGQVKVTDFGIAKAISSSRTKTGVILGTPNYMSPEQIMGQKIGSKSDIFSLGVLFYQLITGELPFRGENLSGLLYQITQVKHPSPRNYNSKIPKVCEQIIDKALAKDPDKRFRNAGEMARIIRALGEKIDQLRKNKAG